MRKKTASPTPPGPKLVQESWVFSGWDRSGRVRSHATPVVAAAGILAQSQSGRGAVRRRQSQRSVPTLDNRLFSGNPCTER